MNNFSHVPVLIDEVISTLKPQSGSCYVDATFGAGGYSKALLNHTNCRVWGIDRDPETIQYGNELEHQYPSQFKFFCSKFSSISQLLASDDIVKVDGIAVDLGVSSLQLDNPIRGFSFKKDGPLDMRMGKSDITAADIVNQMNENELADIIFHYGDEKASRRIARAIIKFREKAPITRTTQLADLVRQVIWKKKSRIDPATKTFQALRIYINKELSELDDLLVAAEMLLKPGGRIVVISFHSLEDRRVKRFLFDRSGLKAQTSRHQPDCNLNEKIPTFKLIQRRSTKSTKIEIQNNPRARSARLRWGERTDEPSI